MPTLTIAGGDPRGNARPDGIRSRLKRIESYLHREARDGARGYGEELEDIEEDEKTDPNVVYSTLEDDEIEHTVTITAPTGGKVTFRIEGDDLHITAVVSGQNESRRSHRLRLTVARSALAEAFDTIGLHTQPSET